MKTYGAEVQVPNIMEGVVVDNSFLQELVYKKLCDAIVHGVLAKYQRTDFLKPLVSRLLDDEPWLELLKAKVIVAVSEEVRERLAFPICQA